MQKLTALTLGAAMIGFCGFIYDGATAQAGAACPAREVSIYFDKDTTAFNKFSQQLVERVATEAKACGSKQVVAEVKSGADRAEAVSSAFQHLGVKVVLVGQPSATPAADSIADREVVIRVASATQSRRVG
jgi:hypothetical protein